MKNSIIFILFFIALASAGCATKSKNNLYDFNHEDRVVSPSKRLNSQY